MSALSGGRGSELAGDVARYGHGSRIPGWDDAVDLTKDPAEIPDPALVAVPAELRTRIEASMAKYPDFRSAAIPALHAAQEVHGWCSPEAIEQVACVMRLTPAYLTAVATFYDMLETRPVGRNAVYVCTNISCSLRGADKLLAAVQAAAGDDPDLNVRAFECLGACDIAPMASVNGAYVGPLELSDAPHLIEQLRAGEDVLPEKQLLRRACADPGAASTAPAGDGDSTPGDAERAPHASPEAEHNASAAAAPHDGTEAAPTPAEPEPAPPTLFDDDEDSSA